MAAICNFYRYRDIMADTSDTFGTIHIYTAINAIKMHRLLYKCDWQ